MGPVCISCRREMKLVKIGVHIQEGESTFYSGDKFSCPDCKHEVITNFGGWWQEYSTYQGDRYPDVIKLVI